MTADLRAGWADLLARRKPLADVLAVYTPIVEAWARATPSVAAPAWEPERCAATWRRGHVLLDAVPPALSRDGLEPTLAVGLEAILRSRPDLGGRIRRFAAAWDAGAVPPASLLPREGRLAGATDGLDAAAAAFLAIVTLRPFLTRHLSEALAHLADGDWELGICPGCGAPPGFSDAQEDGRRRLHCHCCGSAWAARRLWCPSCGTEATRDLVRLEPEGLADQGYSVSACARCRLYLKDLDRRVRWNGGPPLVEDWGSPHLDLVATRAGYRRAVPTLLELARG